MYESPRIRRLRNDLTALEKLRSESSVFQFHATGKPPHHYLVTFKGKGLCRDRGKIRLIYYHRVEVKLGVSYPRSIPELRWLTPVYHPNISEIGMVCLGGYGTHWVPSVQLDELCVMLWDMARYFNYDIRSPYNRDAALWVANQTTILFPTDSRPLRDVRMAQGRIEASNGKLEGKSNGSDSVSGASGRWARLDRSAANAVAGRWDILSPVGRVRQFMERYARATGEGSAPRADLGTPQVGTGSEVSTAADPEPSTTAGPEGLTAPPGAGSTPPNGQDEPGIVALNTLNGQASGNRDESKAGEDVVLHAANDDSVPQRRIEPEDEIVFIE
jgi:ubiquitin-protein ligase